MLSALGKSICKIFDTVTSVTYNYTTYGLLEGGALAENNESNLVNQEQTLDVERIKRRLDMLDQRLDNIDSMVTAVAERVMNQPITLNITCPNCGRNIEITIIGSEKPRA